MSLVLRLQRALEKEDPATEVGKIIGSKHPLSWGMLQAVRFERDYIDLKRSEVPKTAVSRYENYLRKCRDYVAKNTIK